VTGSSSTPEIPWQNDMGTPARLPHNYYCLKTCPLRPRTPNALDGNDLLAPECMPLPIAKLADLSALLEQIKTP